MKHPVKTTGTGFIAQDEAKDTDVLVSVQPHEVDEQLPHGDIAIGAQSPAQFPQLSAVSQLVAQQGLRLQSESLITAVCCRKVWDEVLGHLFKPPPGDR